MPPPPPRPAAPSKDLPRWHSTWHGWILALFIPLVMFLLFVVSHDEDYGAGSWTAFLVSLAVVPVALWLARVDAWTDARGINVINVFHRYEIAWADVATIRVEMSSAEQTRIKRSFGRLAHIFYQGLYAVQLEEHGGSVVRPLAWTHITQRKVTQLNDLVLQRAPAASRQVTSEVAFISGANEVPDSRRRAVSEAVVIGALIAVYAIASLWTFVEGRAIHSSASPAGAAPSNLEVQNRYEGPAVTFEYPVGWTQVISQDTLKRQDRGWYAAYAPPDASPGVFVSVQQAPPLPGGGKAVDAFFAALPGGRVTPVEEVDANGMSAHSVFALKGDRAIGQIVLIQGEKGTYVESCRWLSDPIPLMTGGCKRVRITMVESAPPVIDHATGCTSTALDMLRSMPVPEGATVVHLSPLGQGAPLPKEEAEAGPAVAEEWYDGCDLFAHPAQGTTKDELFGLFGSALKASGWTAEAPFLSRRANGAEVWSMLALRNFDWLLVEAYVEPDNSASVRSFFLTAWDR